MRSQRGARERFRPEGKQCSSTFFLHRPTTPHPPTPLPFPDYVYRPPPASAPRARIPAGPVSRVHDISYYSRDTLGTPLEGDAPADASFGATAAALALPRTVDAAAMRPGSPGAVNPAVARYDPSGLRSAMTTNHAAVRRSVAFARERHLPHPAWMRDGSARPGKVATREPAPGLAGRVNAWGYSQTMDW